MGWWRQQALTGLMVVVVVVVLGSADLARRGREQGGGTGDEIVSACSKPAVILKPSCPTISLPAQTECSRVAHILGCLVVAAYLPCKAVESTLLCYMIAI
jgi:hypothetical protein